MWLVPMRDTKSYTMSNIDGMYIYMIIYIYTYIYIYIIYTYVYVYNYIYTRIIILYNFKIFIYFLILDVRDMIMHVQYIIVFDTHIRT